MKEKLSKFTSLFSEKIEDYVNSAQKNLEKAVAQFEQWKELRAKAIGLEPDPGLIDRVFLETGGINNEQFRNSTDSLYASEDELKSVVQKLFKVNKGPIYVNNAQRRLDSANSLKSAGGESYFNSLMQALGSAISKSNDSQATFDQLINSDSSDFSDFWEIGDVDSPDGPRGLISSLEFFEAVKENGNPLSKTIVSEEDTSSPINPVSEDDLKEIETGNELISALPITEPFSLTEVQSVGALNIPEEIEPTQPSPINIEPLDVETKEPGENQIEKTVTFLEEPFSKGQPTFEPLTLNQTEITPINTADQKISPISKVENVSSESSIINTENIFNENPISNIENISSESPISNIENIFNESFVNTKNNPINQTVSNLLKGDSKSLFNNITSKSPNFFNTQQNETISKTDSSIFNQNLKEIGGSLTNNIEGSPTSNLIDKASTFSSFPVSEIIKPEPITREDISKVGQDVSSSVASSVASGSTLSVGEDTSRRESRAESRAERQESRAESGAERQESKQSKVNVNSDFSMLEKRLKNIELLLMGPLEVKIKN